MVDEINENVVLESLSMATPLVSIAVVSFDNSEYFELLLKGLKRNTVNPYEVLVHCNCASESFRNVVKAHNEITHYQESPVNRFLAEPFNELFAHAVGEYYSRFDDDMYPPPGWDQACIDRVDPQNMYRLITPTWYHRSKVPWNIHDFGSTPQNFEEDRFNAEYLIHRVYTEDIPCGGGFFQPKSLWKTMNGYDLRFPRTCDCEFPNRVWAKVREAIDPICPADAPVYHFGGIGNTKAHYRGPEGAIMPLLIKVFGQEVIDSYNAYRKKSWIASGHPVLMAAYGVTKESE